MRGRWPLNHIGPSARFACILLICVRFFFALQCHKLATRTATVRNRPSRPAGHPSALDPGLAAAIGGGTGDAWVAARDQRPEARPTGHDDRGSAMMGWRGACPDPVRGVCSF
jgi:hypothetical protein